MWGAGSRLRPTSSPLPPKYPSQGVSFFGMLCPVKNKFYIVSGEAVVRHFARHPWEASVRFLVLFWGLRAIFSSFSFTVGILFWN